jgi:uncharacterized protein YwgA
MPSDSTLIRVVNTKLLVLTANYLKKVEGRKRFQKIVYLLQEYHGIEFTYRFTPYLYGPYSARLQNDIDVLAQTTHLKAWKSGYLFCYQITPKGERVSQIAEREYGTERSANLKKHATNLAELDTDELVKWSKDLMNEKIRDNIFRE